MLYHTAPSPLAAFLEACWIIRGVKWISNPSDKGLRQNLLQEESRNTDKIHTQNMSIFPPGFGLVYPVIPLFLPLE